MPSEGGQERDPVVRLFLRRVISGVDILTSDFGPQVRRKVVVCGDGLCGAFTFLRRDIGRSAVDLEQANPCYWTSSR